MMVLQIIHNNYKQIPNIVIIYMFSLKGSRKFNNNFLIRSPKLKGAIVENLLILLCKDLTISDLLSGVKKRLPYLSSYKYSKSILYILLIMS
jgi:hypothetical protein